MIKQDKSHPLYCFNWILKAHEVTTIATGTLQKRRQKELGRQRGQKTPREQDPLK